MPKEAELIYKILEDSLNVNRWAPKILKIIGEKGNNINGRWVSISYREWAEYGINTFTFNRVIKWAIEQKIVESKDAPQNGKRGKKRKMYRLNLGR